jgi:putative tryptophan/tyrosine transport system substrate-binding protein
MLSPELGAAMRRRNFLALVGGAAIGWSLAARAQQPAMPVIGLLGSASPDLWASRLSAFRQGLSETDYIEGRNVAIEYRWAEGRNDRLPDLAADLVQRRVNVIAAVGSTPAALAAKAATTTIPIVFEIAADPVELGLVASLARPGANITGVTTLNAEVEPKQLELLHGMVPGARRIAFLVNPTNPTVAESSRKVMQASADRLGVQLDVLQASTISDFDAVFEHIAHLQDGALAIGADAFFTSHLQELANLAFRRAVPAAYQFREFAAAGGLFSYGASLTDTFRLAGNYAGRIIKGDKAADLPVQQATKVELTINLKTAKALGLTLPLPLLGRADEVIE